MKLKFLRYFMGLLILTGISSAAQAALITDPNDPRTWQGASVGTFANLYYGSNTLTTRQQVVADQLLDDGIFNTTGASAAKLITSSTGGKGMSTDTTGTGSYAYTGTSATYKEAADSIDNLWVQTNNVIGDYIWDFGYQATKAAVFNTIDHGPLPGEAIESTVYLSNDQISWTEAVTERVWLEGFHSNTGILWDGFVYAVGTGTTDTFRFASVIWGGPGALISDGDNEINGLLGLDGNFQAPPNAVPIPAAIWLFGSGLIGLLGLSRKKRLMHDDMFAVN